jgi:hypothetical protein
MQITVEFTWLVGLLLGFMGVLWAFAKLFAAQFKNHLDERFVVLDTRFSGIENSLKEGNSERHEQGRELHLLNEKLHHVEIEMERIQAEIPKNFVTRAEWMKSPNHEDLQKMYKAVGDLSATVNQLVGESKGQTDTLRLILNKMVSNSKELP